MYLNFFTFSRPQKKAFDMSRPQIRRIKKKITILYNYVKKKKKKKPTTYLIIAFICLWNEEHNIFLVPHIHRVTPTAPLRVTKKSFSFLFYKSTFIPFMMGRPGASKETPTSYMHLYQSTPEQYIPVSCTLYCRTMEQ